MRALIGSILIVAASVSLAAPDTAVYEQAVTHAGRSAKDRERDARERPAEIMAFAGFKPGMHFADIFAGGGYYIELISYVVGPSGEVLMVNNVPYEDYAKEMASYFRATEPADFTERPNMPYFWQRRTVVRACCASAVVSDGGLMRAPGVTATI